MNVYQLEIKDDALCIQGIFGKYEAEDYGNGEFNISVVRDECVNELDSEGEEYLVDAGREWSVPVKSLSELNGFISKCEEERLWNYMFGPIFKIKLDNENGVLYMKGFAKNFAIGECDKGFYVDEMQSSKHNVVDNFVDGMRTIVMYDKWWNRPIDDTIDIINNTHCYAKITDGGNLKIEIRNKIFVIGEKEGGGYWINITGGQERHVYYKDKWKEVIGLIFGS